MIKIKFLNTGHDMRCIIICSILPQSQFKSRTCCSSKLWVLNSGREDLLEKDSMYLYKDCVLCAKHFEDSCFRNYKKIRLHETAVQAKIVR